MKHCGYILAVGVGALLLAIPASADVVNLNYVAVATGVDEGPQDGIFDSFAPASLGSVNNNGFTSFRTAFEFSLSGVPTGSIVNAASVTMTLSNFDGTRAIEVHGYAGSGTVQLSDFSLNGLVATASIGPQGTQTLTFDVTSFVADLVANARTFAGFNVREEPANTSNFEVMFLDLVGTPVLSIDFTAEQIVDIDIKPGGTPNSINSRSEGKIPVAILSTSKFDAPTEVDETSLTFGRTGDEASLAFCGAPQDVNGDGLSDLVCHFKTSATNFLLGDTQGVLKGHTLGGVPIMGTDSVRIVR